MWTYIFCYISILVANVAATPLPEVARASMEDLKNADIHRKRADQANNKCDIGEVENAEDSFCEEGENIKVGDTCTPQCKDGFVAVDGEPGAVGTRRINSLQCEKDDDNNPVLARPAKSTTNPASVASRKVETLKCQEKARCQVPQIQFEQAAGACAEIDKAECLGGDGADADNMCSVCLEDGQEYAAVHAAADDDTKMRLCPKKECCVQAGTSCTPACDADSGYEASALNDDGTAAPAKCNNGVLEEFSCQAKTCKLPALTGSANNACMKGSIDSGIEVYSLVWGESCFVACNASSGKYESNAQKLTCKFDAATKATVLTAQDGTEYPIGEDGTAGTIQCKPAQCPQPTTVTNGGLFACVPFKDTNKDHGKTDHNSYCVPQCGKGYETTTDQLDCQYGSFELASGATVNQPFTCTEARCGAPQTDDGNFDELFGSDCTKDSDNKYAHNTTCRVKCKTGYSGVPTRVTCSMGEWSTDIECKADGCPVQELLLSAGANIQNTKPGDGPCGALGSALTLPEKTVEHGAQCAPQCKKGYRPKIPNTGRNADGTMEGLDCEAGQFKPSSFTCEEIDCDAFPQAAHSPEQNCEGGIPKHGEQCTTKCNDGYVPTAQTKKLTCEFGEYIDGPLNCQAKNCTLYEDDNVVSGSECDSRWQMKAGETCTVSCKEDNSTGFKYVPKTETVFCQVGVPDDHQRVKLSNGDDYSNTNSDLCMESPCDAPTVDRGWTVSLAVSGDADAKKRPSNALEQVDSGTALIATCAEGFDVKMPNGQSPPNDILSLSCDRSVFVYDGNVTSEPYFTCEANMDKCVQATGTCHGCEEGSTTNCLCCGSGGRQATTPGYCSTSTKMCHETDSGATGLVFTR